VGVAVVAAAEVVAGQDGETCAISAAAMSAPSLPTPGKTLVSFPHFNTITPTVYTKDASSFSQDRLGTNTRKRSIYQDRLGTNIWKLNKKGGVFRSTDCRFNLCVECFETKGAPIKLSSVFSAISFLI
jgi:hypothetical protein